MLLWNEKEWGKGPNYRHINVNTVFQTNFISQIFSPQSQIYSGVSWFSKKALTSLGCRTFQSYCDLPLCLLWFSGHHRGHPVPATLIQTQIQTVPYRYQPVLCLCYFGASKNVLLSSLRILSILLGSVTFWYLCSVFKNMEILNLLCNHPHSSDGTWVCITVLQPKSLLFPVCYYYSCSLS